MRSMKKYLSGKSALTLAAAGIIFSSTFLVQPVQAADGDLKMAFFASPKHPVWSVLMNPWGKRLTAGNVGLKIAGFPGGQIGGKPPGAFKRVVNGIADIEFHIPGYTSTLFPRSLVMEIPLQYGNSVEATKAIWNIYNKHIAPDYKRVKLIGLWGTDVPVIMTNKVVRTPADLKGLKLRTPSRNQAAIIKAFGAIPVAMPMPQTYGALEKGVVDGAIVGISVVKSFKLAEVVKNYIVDLPMGFSPQIVAMNTKAFNKLSPQQKAFIDKNSGLEFSLIGARSYDNSRKQGIATITKRPDTSITKLTAAEKKLWVDKLQSVVKTWVKGFDKQGLPYTQMVSDYLKK
jgi:TRAP-type transport system periplasmic protein